MTYKHTRPFRCADRVKPILVTDGGEDVDRYELSPKEMEEMEEALGIPVETPVEVTIKDTRMGKMPVVRDPDTDGDGDDLTSSERLAVRAIASMKDRLDIDAHESGTTVATLYINKSRSGYRTEWTDDAVLKEPDYERVPVPKWVRDEREPPWSDVPESEHETRNDSDTEAEHTGEPSEKDNNS